MLWLIRSTGLLLVAVALVLLAAWAGLVLLYSPLVDASLRAPLAGLWAVGSVVTFAAWMRRRWRGRATLLLLAGIAVVGAGWSMLAPSNDRDWQPELAVLPSATFDGDLVTIRNIRNADYRSETDFDLRYYDKTFDLNQLDSVDLIATYWMGPSIAHTMLSFGFGGKDFIAFSIEARKQSSESYSSVLGFFRQYELVYVAADERDVVRLRTNYRKDPVEDVYIYRLHGDPGATRRIFLDYLRAMNELTERPAWYNSLTHNCTGTIWLHAAVNPGRVPFSWKILLSGYAPQYLHDMGRMTPGMSFQELQAKGRANARGQAADQAADFSRRIREGVPGHEPPNAGQASPAR